MHAIVAGRELKSVFLDVAPLMKGYDRARVIGIETTKNSITFTADVGTYYTRTLSLRQVTDGISLSMTVVFTDISNFINAREDVQLEFTQYYFSIKTAKAAISLSLGESIVAPYQPRGGRATTLDYPTLHKTLKVFASTTDLQKAFSRDFAISFYGDWALMRTPTVYIRTRSQGLEGVLSLDQFKSVLAFQPEYVEESDRLEFHKGDAILSIPRSVTTQGDTFNNYRKDLPHVSNVVMEGVVRELAEVKRTIGVAEATVYLYQVGFALEIAKGGTLLKEEYNIAGDMLFSFKYMLDIFLMCLNILGENTDIKVYAKGELVCLESPDTAILLSV